MAGRRILVVDDDREIREILVEFLQDGGHHVAAAGSGREAMEAVDAAAKPFGVAIVDWHMAGISGRDVIAHIHERSPDTVIYVSTGYGVRDLSDSFTGDFVAGILRKPFPLSRIARELASLPVTNDDE